MFRVYFRAPCYGCGAGIVRSCKANQLDYAIGEQHAVYLDYRYGNRYRGCHCAYSYCQKYQHKMDFCNSLCACFSASYLLANEFIALAFDGSGATTGDVSVPFILALGLGISATFSKSKTNEDSLGIIGIASVGPIVAVLVYGIIVKAINGGTLPPELPYDISTTKGFGDIILGNIFDVALAVLPIVIIAIPFLLFLLKLPKRTFAQYMLGVIPVYLGLLVFLSGIDFGFGFIGQYIIGQMFFDGARPEWFKWLLLLVGFILGAAITVSEPAVTVLGVQIEELTNGHIKKMTIRITLALGIGIASLLSILKILTEINILYFLVPLYAVALIMMIFTPKLFVGLAFDSGGVTGGALTSAFLTPLTLSIAKAVAEANGSAMSILTNGFGIISFISVTPLIAIQLLGIIYNLRLKRAEKEETAEALGELESFVLQTDEQDEHTTNEREENADE